MAVPLPVSASPRRHLWPLAAVATVAFVYAFGHLGWYLGTPLGRVPVLDEAENLALANAISRHALPAEPFYRAPGYALLLSWLGFGAATPADLFARALALGAALHALNAVLAAQIARAWFGRGAALGAGLLFALHPVFVHYSTQALDAVPALTFFLAGLCCLAPAFRSGATLSGFRWSAASLAWASATLLRPNYLLVWLALPLFALWRASRDTRGRVTAAAGTGAALFVALAAWQWRVSGVAGFLPWQGAYNLWAANQPGAHGRYYVQHVSLPAALAAQNPARVESALRYREETGRAPDDIAAMNAHWRARFADRVLHQPLDWLGQLARKTYALLDDWEQYNNKTFAFHRARSPWLRWNPLSWGVLFVLGVAGVARLAAEDRVAARAALLLAAATSLSIVLFFVSARFRLPLAALTTVLAGGALAAPTFWRAWPRPRQIALGLALAAAAALTFSNFDGVRDRSTFVQDHALLARAAATVGDDALAWRESVAALALQPAHPDALRVAVASYFNLLLDAAAPPTDEPRWHEDARRLLAAGADDTPDLRAVAALALWRAGDTTAALAEWRRLGATPSAIAARLLAHDETARAAELAAAPPASWSQPLVRLAAAEFSIAPPADIAAGISLPAREVAARLFAARRAAAP
ncbi:MAG TPA: hypothetical protein VHD62_11515 [Opitutaceae bacterium]|nr:hypothetical protein [Opitutaceae bacterium]